MEDDWKETSSDLEDFLRMSQRYYDQEDSNPPCKDPLLSSKTKTASQEDGQDDLFGVREALGSLYPSPTTTPCKGNGAVDPEGSTIFYDRWDELTEGGKDRAFDLWTSPVVMRTPGVIRILEEERMIGGYANNEGRSQEDDLEKKELRSPEPPVGSLDKHTTGKPIPVIDNDILFVAKLDQEGLKEGGVDVTTTPPHPGDEVNIVISGPAEPPETMSKEDISQQLTMGDVKNQPQPQPQPTPSDDSDARDRMTTTNPPTLEDDITPSPSPSSSQQTRGRASTKVYTGEGMKTKPLCVYNKGVCSLHGKAVKKLTTIPCMVTGPDGVKTKKYVKKTSYRCDLDANGRKLRQPGLPFVRMTADDRRGGADDSSNGGWTTSNFSTSKEGQRTSCVRDGMRASR